MRIPAGRAPRVWALLFTAILPVFGGCRTLHADREEWTKTEALDKLRGYYPEILEVTPESISVPNWVQGGKEPLKIRYEDISEVRVTPQVKGFVLWIIVGTLFGPFIYDMEVELKNGWTVPIIKKCRWALSFTPGGYYPNVLIHGYGPGYALDWLRQNAQEKWENPPGK
ncbi:MAG: hypothetical protein FD180_4049 [Planctomycetota bacterium]|nr:MAG: hypothetical protein FD180_4049 [Planctomycetota bacterium]